MTDKHHQSVEAVLSTLGISDGDLPNAPQSRVTATTPRPGMVLAERYKLLELIGGGGMGVVWRAKDLVQGDSVALKIMHAHIMAHPVARERFQREASNAAALNHINIVRVLDFGEHAHMPFLVMEHIQGVMLMEIIQGRRLPWRRAVAIASQVLHALHTAHSHPKCIIHRDIKPSNIILLERGDVVDLVKVLDFGVSKSLGGQQRVDLTQSPIGTPDFMAPELWRNKNVGPTVDLYALGCMVYQMLTGQMPFYADTIPMLSIAHCRHTRPPVVAKAPREIKDWVHRMMAIKPEDRPESALAALQQLQQLLAAYPLTHSGAHPRYVRGHSTPSNPAQAATLTSTPPVMEPMTLLDSMSPSDLRVTAESWRSHGRFRDLRLHLHAILNRSTGHGAEEATPPIHGADHPKATRAVIHEVLGKLALFQGYRQVALQHFTEAIAIHEHQRHPETIWWLQWQLGALYIAMDKHTRLRQTLLLLDHDIPEQSSWPAAAWLALLCARAGLHFGQPQIASKALGQALSAADRHQDHALRLGTLRSLAHFYIVEGHMPRAESALMQAKEHMQHHMDAPEQALCRCLELFLKHHEGHASEANRLFDEIDHAALMMEVNRDSLLGRWLLKARHLLGKVHH